MAEEKDGLKFPGRKWRARAGGRRVPVWVASPEAVKEGFPTKTASLTDCADNPVIMSGRCQRLQAEMLAWLAGIRSSEPVDDGTFRALFDLYERDDQSPYHGLKPSTRKPYEVYLRALRSHIGAIQISRTDGRDVSRWWKKWAGVDHIKDPKARIPRANMMLAVLKAAARFGAACKATGCAELYAALLAMSFPSPKPRRTAPVAGDIEKARAAAHAEGAPSRAFAYALQFETTLRQWDVIGQWVPLSDLRPSSVIHKGMKWIGPTWANVDSKLILRLTPTKTEDSTEASVGFDLTECPMVMAELERIPLESRAGPLIVHEFTGLPYLYSTWNTAWHRDFTAAGISKKVWNRDLRAGGNTEASKAGVSREDRARVAGHSERVNATVYDRDTVEAHRRMMKARKESRS